MPKELVHAPRLVLEAVIAEAVVPCVRGVEKERGCDLPLAVTPWQPHMTGPSILITNREPQPGEAPTTTGHMRLLFRKNYGGDRYLFLGRALYPDGFTPHKGFAGFEVQGAVQMAGEAVQEVQWSTWSVLWGEHEPPTSF